jgi:hypothetical protein
MEAGQGEAEAAHGRTGGARRAPVAIFPAIVPAFEDHSPADCAAATRTLYRRLRVVPQPAGGGPAVYSIPNRSISNTSVLFGGICGGAPRAP